MKTITQFKSIESFFTERLIACKLEAKDVEKLVVLHSNSYVMAALGGIQIREETQKYLNLNLRHWEKNRFGLWMFYCKETNEWIGRGGLRRLEIDGFNEVEIFYALMTKFWKKGFASEIAKACSEIAFEVIHLDNVVCLAEKTHIASQKVMEKVGFYYEKDFLYEDVKHVLYRMKNPHIVEKKNFL